MAPFPTSLVPHDAGHSIRNPPAKDHSKQARTNDRDLWIPVLYQSPLAGIGEAFPSLSSVSNVNLHFDYYRIHVSKVSFPFSATEMATCFFRKALDQPALAETMLFLSASSHTANLVTRGAAASEVRKSFRDMIQLRSRVMKSLQEIIMRPSEVQTELTVAVIANLLCVEAAQGNLEEVDAHVAGLKGIIDVLGGLEVLGDWAITTIYCCDLMRGLLLDSPPVFDLLPNWALKTQNGCAYFKSYNPSFSVGERFFSSTWSPNIPPQLQSIIQSFQQVIPCFESMADLESRTLTFENDYLLLLMHQLYSLPYDYPLEPLHNTIRLSVMIYAVVRIWKLEGKPGTECLVQRYRQSIEKGLDYLERTAPDLLFWALFLSSLASLGLPSHGWCLVNVRKAAVQLGLKNWNDAKRVLEDFFFVCRPRNENAKTLWDSDIERYSRRL